MLATIWSDLNWVDLVIALVTTVLGWLSGSLRPPPGTIKTPPADTGG